MKRFINFLCLAAFATAIFAGCSKNDSPENLPETSVKKVSFKAKAADTKSVFGEKESNGYPTIWTENQKVSIALNFGEASGSTKEAAVIPSSNGRTASFDAEIADDESGEYVFYAASPAASTISWNATYASVQIDFPANQVPTSTSVDEKAHIMFAQSETFTTFPDETNTVTLPFSHLAAYGKFQFRELPETVTINSIELTAEENVAGRFYFYPETGELSANSAGKSVTLDVSELDIDKNNTTDFWFSFAPVNLEGKTLKVSVHTDAGVYAKTITFPTGKGNFQAGRVATFTINMSGITPGEDEVYVLLTDKKQLLPGAKAIIVAQDAEIAMSTTQNTNNRGTISVDKSEDLQTITNPGDAVQVFVLEAGTVSGTVAFNCYNGDQVDKYIGAASSSSNYLRSFAENAANTSFSVTIEDGYTVLVANDYTRNVMRYNGGNTPPVFSCYASSSSVKAEVAVYVLEGSGEGSSLINDPKCPTPEISFDSSTNTVTITCSATESRIGYTTDGTDPGLNDAGEPIGTTQEYTEPFTITETCTVKAFAGAPGYEMSEIAEKECVVAASVLPENTIDDPYTVDVILDAIAELPDNNATTEKYYIIGTVSQITEIGTSYGNATYYISDGTDELYIFRGKNLDNTDFTSANQLAVGDEVIVYGSIQNYHGDTPEVPAGNYLVYRNHTASSHTVTYTQPSEGGSFTVTVDGNPVTSGAELEEGTTVTLTASAASGYNFSSWTVTGATVSGNTTTATFTVGVSDVTIAASFSSASLVSETLSGTFTSSDGTLTLTTESGITVVQAKGTGSNAVNATYNTPSTLRMYKGHTLTFSGKTIKKIEITVNGTYYGNTLTADSGTLTPTTTSGGTITWEGSADSVTITNTATGTNVQLRPASIVVYY